MKKSLVLIILALIGAGGYAFLASGEEKEPVAEQALPVETIPEVRITTDKHIVQENETFTAVMEALGLEYAEALRIVDAAQETFDFTSIKVGKPFTLVYEDDVATKLEYEPGTEYKIVVDLQNEYQTTKEEIVYDVTLAWAEVTINESLFVDGLNADLPEVLLLQFVDIFAWDIDFATQVQANDSYRILYEKRSRDGQEAGVGDILYGSFTNIGQTSDAYRFTDGQETRYYTGTGESLVREFLKAPLNFRRISSGYTNARFHPVTGTTMPHRAIDYAAPIGTPIKAVADGTVTMAQYYGGYGNYIDIRHNSVYETQYAHLSKFAVRAGQHVTQGQVIGYVGSTGWSTGPHLHYQVKVNGQLQNPLEVEFPKGDPITEEKRAEFDRQKAEIDTLLASYPQNN